MRMGAGANCGYGSLNNTNLSWLGSGKLQPQVGNIGTLILTPLTHHTRTHAARMKRDENEFC